jgi:hypothetical protein
MKGLAMKKRMLEAALLACALATPSFGQGSDQKHAVHLIHPQDDPQTVLDHAAPGDRIVFLPGLHQHHTTKYNSILYVDKSVDIELQAGATLKLADNETMLEATPEITTDQGVTKKTDDLEAGGNYDLSGGPRVYAIRIDHEGPGGAPDTFTWGSGNIVAGDQVRFQHSAVPITGEWQELSSGVKIHFRSRAGHNAGSIWYISYDGRESYGIRIGHGTQRDYIDGVRIFGRGVIDLNREHNVEPSFLVKDINACVLIHGRVRNVSIEGITMTNTNRSVMVYGEHTGKFLQGGASGPGEYFDAENISIFHTRTINPRGSGYLLGHPSHRGRLTDVRCNFNYMETLTTAIEPNFQLDQYEVIGNVIRSEGRAIHCWRHSTNGLIADNIRIGDSTGKEVVMLNAPAAWQPPENITLRDNRNLLSEPVGYWASIAGGFENRASGKFGTVSGGERNTAAGIGASVPGGSGNEAVGDYSTARGIKARATRYGEDVLASGMFAQPGDAQISQLVIRQVTTDDAPAVLTLTGNSQITIPANESASYRIFVVARGKEGAPRAAFEATGLVSRSGSGDLTLSGNQVTAIYQSDPQIAVHVLADAKSGTLQVQAQGLSNKTIRWVGRIELTEVGF